MIIKKNSDTVKLKKSLTELLQVEVYIGKGNWLFVSIIPIYDLYKLHETNPIDPNLPKCIGLNVSNQTLVIYPKTDKRYKIRVIGTQLVTQ